MSLPLEVRCALPRAGLPLAAVAARQAKPKGIGASEAGVRNHWVVVGDSGGNDDILVVALHNHWGVVCDR